MRPVEVSWDGDGVPPLVWTDTHLWKQYLPVVLLTRTVTMATAGIYLRVWVNYMIENDVLAFNFFLKFHCAGSSWDWRGGVSQLAMCCRRKWYHACSATEPHRIWATKTARKCKDAAQSDRGNQILGAVEMHRNMNEKCLTSIMKLFSLGKKLVIRIKVKFLYSGLFSD